MELTEVDPEVAGRAFARDLERTWSTGRPEHLGWSRTRIDDLTTTIEMPARLADGKSHPYYLLLRAAHYGPHPVQVNFVLPETWEIAAGTSRWFPRLESLPPWFGLHATYKFQDGSQRQLVCFSFNSDYYISEHSCKATEIWQQGRHTVAATLYRLYEILGPAYYRGPSQQLAEAA